MANNFQINIVAVDKATAAIRKITQTLERVTKPIDKMKKAFGALSKDLGLDRIQSSLVKVRRAAESVSESFGKIVPSLGAITSIASIAGVARLASMWGAAGMNIRNTADNIGISVQSLQELEGAAKYAGISTQSLDAGLMGLSTTLQDAAMGRNNQAAQVMRNFGLELHRTADGSVDVKRALMDMARIVPTLTKPAQRQLGEVFGISQLLPLLRQGDKGIQEFVARAIASGNVMTQQQVQNAIKYDQSVTDMKNSIDGLSKSIGSTFIPALKPVVDNLSKWIATHHQLATTIAGGAVALSVWKIAKSAVGLAADLTGSLMPALSGGMMRLGLLTEGFGKFLRFIPGMQAATGLIADAFLAVGAAIEATPVGWFLTAVAAIGAAAYLIYNNWDGISAWFSKKWQSVKETFSGFKKWLFSLDLYEAGKHVADSLMQSLKRNLASWMPKSLQRFLGLDEWLGSAGSATTASAANSGQATPSAAPATSGPVSTWDRLKYKWLGQPPIGIRQNNPGNLRSWGHNPIANGFAQFSTPTAGIAAMAQQLRLYGHRGINSLDRIIGTYAPSSENNVGAYVNDVSRQTGFSANQRLNLSDPAVLAPLVSAMIKHENGRNPYDANTINQAVGNPHVEVTVHAPAGTKAAVKTNGNVTSRVSYAMNGPT